MRKVVGIVAFGGVLAFALGGFAGSALAQASAGNTADRARTASAEMGIPMGGFLLQPSFLMENRFDDNIFAVDSDFEDKVDDIVSIFSPEVIIASRWSNHSLAFDAGADIRQYWDESNENTEDYHLGVQGRADIRRSTSLSGGYEFSRSHEERGSVDNVFGALKPTTNTRHAANVLLRHDGARVGTQFGVDYQKLNFKDSETPLIVINNDDRDREVFDAHVRIGAGPSNRRVFGEARYRDVAYKSDLDDLGLNRDNDGFRFVGGIEFRAGGKTIGEVSAGYTERKYKDPTLEKVDGIVFDASLTTEVTGSTSLTASIAREILETTLTEMTVPASGVFATVASVGTTTELSRDRTFLNFLVAYGRDSYKGVDRSDNSWRLSSSIRHFLGRRFFVELGYTYRTRSSNSVSPNSDFSKNLISLNFGVQR